MSSSSSNNRNIKYQSLPGNEINNERYSVSPGYGGHPNPVVNNNNNPHTSSVSGSGVGSGISANTLSSGANVGPGTSVGNQQAVLFMGNPTQSSNAVGSSSKGLKPQEPRQPKRTTKTSQKLTLFPKDILGDEAKATDESFGNESAPILPHVSKGEPDQLLNRLERRWLPRVTGYCTANSYRMDALYDYLLSRGPINHTSPKRFDEALYTPYSTSKRRATDGKPTVGDLLGISTANGMPLNKIDQLVEQDDRTVPSSPNRSLMNFLNQNVDSFGQSLPSNLPYPSLANQISPMGELFFFDYGVVVMWGLPEEEEKIVLENIRAFEEEKLSSDHVEAEELHFHYSLNSQSRIYNDVITLKSPSNPFIKLTISHAIAQSVKLALYEELIEDTIDSTKHIPQILSETGKIQMSRKAINQKIGQLFIMRINVNLVSNVLDTPDVFWFEPGLEPIYRAIRGYLEINQRVELLNQRVSVISDLLDMLKDHLNSHHGEQLEWIVIILIGFEIVIGLLTICFDYFGYELKKGNGGGHTSL